MNQSEQCAECRFDGGAFTHNDVLGTLRAIPGWWDLITRGVDDAAAQQRVAPDQWSIVEYGIHTAEVTKLHAVGLEMMLDAPGTALGPLEDGGTIAEVPAVRLVADTMWEIVAAFEALHPFAERATDASNFITVGDERLDAPWLIRHTCHDALHHLQDIGRIVHALGAGPPRHTGVVDRINVSRGGVPKVATDRVDVGYRGIVGDRQRSRLHHGRTWQALCLYSGEAIDRLRAEGHSISAGAAGENFTLRGIDWAALRPGVRLRIGSVVAETTLPALPCAKNAQWFTDGDFNRMHHLQHWNETRWYARVLEDGIVNTGDEVSVEPT